MTVPIEGRDADQLVALLEALENNDDVQHVYANYEFSDAELERLENA